MRNVDKYTIGEGDSELEAGSEFFFFCFLFLFFGTEPELSRFRLE